MEHQINPDEIVLVKECLEGQRRAQKALYDKYKDAMYTLAYRITGNFEDAGDAIQDGFIQVFNSLESYQAKASLGAWIKTIIVRTSYKHVKQHFSFYPIEDLIIEDEFSWDDHLNGEELEKAILALSPGYRLIFNLVEIEGYKHQEVAELLKISVGTSKSQLHHAKKMLQKELGHIIES